jgi:hypothetical protein
MKQLFSSSYLIGLSQQVRVSAWKAEEFMNASVGITEEMMLDMTMRIFV